MEWSDAFMVAGAGYTVVFLGLVMTSLIIYTFAAFIAGRHFSREMNVTFEKYFPSFPVPILAENARNHPML